MEKKKLFVGLLLVVGILFFINGCASTGKLMDNASLKTEVRIRDSVFLNLTLPKTVYVKITNTSDLQNIVLEPVVKEKLSKKGIQVADNPDEASWIIQANVRSFTYRKESSGSTDGAVAGAGMGGFFGGVGSALSKSNNVGIAVGAVAGSIIGNVAGAAVGTMFKVESYSGEVDLQIKEKVPGGVRGKMVTDVRNASTTMTTEREVVSDYQTYNTVISVVARRTNINIEDAVKEMVEKISDQIAGLW